MDEQELDVLLINKYGSEIVIKNCAGYGYSEKSNLFYIVKKERKMFFARESVQFLGFLKDYRNIED
jgi:hypothetical protein